MGRTGTILLLVIGVTFLSGCAEIPKEPVMRPIPPPPPGPPPGVATVIHAPAPAGAASVSTNASIRLGNYEISSNYVGVADTTNVAAQAAAGTPQYELIPPRPGPDYLWRDGFWRWEGKWVWVPGVWEYRPSPVIFIEPGFSYHYGFGGPWHHHYYGPRAFPHRHHRHHRRW
jgi:hypothetical protein